MNSIISEEQTGFVQRHSILDGVIVAQEAMHTLQNTKRAGMLLKLDISKAYDNVDWRFLCKILQAFGFNVQWINWIFELYLNLEIFSHYQWKAERIFLYI